MQDPGSQGSGAFRRLALRRLEAEESLSWFAGL